MDKKFCRIFPIQVIRTSLIFIFFVIIFLILGNRVQAAGQQARLLVPSTTLIEGNLEAQHRILLAFAEGYPEMISDVRFLNNDWTMLVNGTRFYYAHGRFLPEGLRLLWEDYIPYDFYLYPWTGTAAQRRAFMDNPVYSAGSSFLLETIYSSPTEDASWELQEKYSFFGVKMLVHQYIKPKLDRVLADIRVAALTDPSINEWIAELQTGIPNYGWVWREIAGTNRRSMHSYGIAIDLLPVDLKGRLTYWRWNASGTGNVINRQTYYMPPDSVIRIFQEYGFIWGGNWALIDTMHFEFRPEILLLNGFTIRR